MIKEFTAYKGENDQRKSADINYLIDAYRRFFFTYGNWSHKL